MHQHKEGIETSLIDTKTHLDKLHNEITRTLEKINSREKYINNQLEHLLGEFRATQEQLSESKERYRQASGEDLMVVGLTSTSVMIPVPL
jgi:estrogen-related receptor beta like 1